MRVWSLASLSRLRIRCCLEQWWRPAAAALIQPLTWEPPYATCATLKSKKKKKKKSYSKTSVAICEKSLLSLTVFLKVIGFFFSHLNTHNFFLLGCVVLCSFIIYIWRVCWFICFKWWLEFIGIEYIDWCLSWILENTQTLPLQILLLPHSFFSPIMPV